MKKLCLLFFFLFSFLVILSPAAEAQENIIDPYLQNVLNQAQPNDMIRAYVVLKNRLGLEDLQTETAWLPKKERQREVVRLLKQFADSDQANIRSFLQQAQSQSDVERIDIIWAINVISFTAKPSVINQLAASFPEVMEIRYDPVIAEEMLTDHKDMNQSPSQMLSDFAPQQGLLLINAPAVWALGDSGQGIVVANIDTGTDWDHPDLVHNIWNNLGEDFDNDGHTMEWNGSAWVFDPGDINGVDNDGNGLVDDFIGWDYSDGDNNPYNPGSSHGTSTSGIVAGDGTNGTQTGVAPKAKLLILRPNGEAQNWLSQQYAMDKGVDVITSSLSYKWYFSPQPNYPMWRQMTDMELAAGIVHTNSTSNDGNNLSSAPIPFNISAPGNCPTAWVHPDQTIVGGVSAVIGVGNVLASTDVIVSSSPHGPATWEDIQVNHPSYPFTMPSAYQDYPYETLPGSIGLIKPDVSAPGNGTVSTVNGTGYSSFSGTSGATPHVAGVVALMLGVNPMLSVEDVSRILQTTAVEKGAPGKDNRYGAGRIDALAAYLQAVNEIPVELSSFTALSEGNDIVLNWTTITETNNSGFVIERKSGSDWENAGTVAGHGTTTEVQNYTFRDVNLKTGVYFYRLKQIDFDGTSDYSPVIEIEIGGPVEFSLNQNYPNPFNPATVIEFSLPVKSNVRLEVFSILGEKVAELVNGELEAGYHGVEFLAEKLTSGTYIYRLEAAGEQESFVKTNKMLLLK